MDNSGLYIVLSEKQQLSYGLYPILILTTLIRSEVTAKDFSATFTFQSFHLVLSLCF